MKKVAVVVGIACIGVSALLIGPRVSSGAVAPDFTLYPGGGAVPVSLSDLKGKVVVLDFWASWCAPCRMAVPELESINQAFARRGVVVLGINVNDQGDPREALRSLGGTYPTLLQGETAATDYGVEGLPTVIVIGRDGTIRFKEAGYSPLLVEKLREAVEEAAGDR